MIDPKIFAESGVLLVDKPAEWTSHDVVNCVRSRFQLKKVGHAGTLDPAATGLLVLLLGKATKLSARFMGHDKTYAGTIRLGVQTTTLDAAGEVTATAPTTEITESEVIQAARRFVGHIEQIPPMVSALKKNGQRLYKLARKGIDVQRDPRPVTIHAFSVSASKLPDVEFRVECSKGTYVRSLADDLGRTLGCGAHLLNLRRVACGNFSIDRAFTMEKIKTWERDELFQNFIPLIELEDYLI